MARYKVIGELGRGGMGVVLRAMHVDLGREVALKFLPASFSGDKKFLQRFHREVRTLASLSHPNIVRVFDSGEMQGQPYFTMEIVRGADLHEATVLQRQAMGLERSLALIAQAADALAHIHARGMCHRDVKLRNLMVDDRDHVTLMDFGLAKSTEATMLTGEGQVLGTPKYIAPEVLLGEEARSPADVYALALCLHELVTGSEWVQTCALNELLLRITNGPSPELPGAPPWLAALQARALSHDPEKRPGAAEYRDEIRSLGEPAGANERTEGPPIPGCPDRPESEPVVARANRPGRWVAPVALLCLTVGLLAPARRPPPPLQASPTASAPSHELTGSSDRATHAIELGPVRFSPSRCATIEVRGRPEAGWSVRLEALDGSFATTAPADGRATLRLSLPSSCELRATAVGPAGRPLSGPLRFRTPDRHGLGRFTCHPTDQAVLVDFDWPPEQPCTVEIGRWGGPVEFATMHRSRKPFFHRVFPDLAPDTDYFARVNGSSPWSSLADFRFRTNGRDQSLALVELKAGASKDIRQLDFLIEAFLQVPDSRLVPLLFKLIDAIRPGSSGPLLKIARFAAKTRIVELADRLVPFVDRIDDVEVRRAIIDSLIEARHPRAFEIADANLERSTDPVTIEICATGVARAGGPAVCDRIAARRRQVPFPSDLGTAMVRADPDRARFHFAGWIDRPGARDPVVALTMLKALGGRTAEPDLDLLEPLLAADRALIRDAAAGTIAATGGAYARRILGRAFQTEPARSSLLWAVGRMGLAEETPAVARLLAATRSATRRDAAMVLGLLEARDREAELVRRLEDDDDEVADGAAWALAWAGGPGAIAPLIRRASSERDRRGCAAWALGQLGDSRALAPLIERATLLERRGERDEIALGLTIWALGRVARATTGAAASVKERLDRLATRPDTAPFAREAARMALSELGRPEPDRHGGCAAPGTGQVYTVLPLSRLQRTGIRLETGESLDVSCRGSFCLGSGSRPRPADQAQPLVQSGTDLRVEVSIGTHRLRVEKKKTRWLAPAAGEVILSAWSERHSYPTTNPVQPPLGEVSGMAWVTILR